MANGSLAQLELEIGDDGTKVGIAAAFAITVDRSLYVRRARGNCGERVGHCQLSIVMTVDADGYLDLFNDGLGNASHIVRKAAAVSVAEHDAVRFACRRRA